MEKKVIIYGLGSQYEKYKLLIEKEYNVIAYTDGSESKRNKYVNQINVILPEEIQNMDYDVIMITSVFRSEIINDLIDQYKIDRKKIKIWDYEYKKRNLYGEPIIGNFNAGYYEDAIINELIGKLGIEINKMHYLEIGVCEPIFASNTYYFYERGARGILIEANPGVINHIQLFRSEDKIINKAIYDEYTVIPFYVCNELGLSSLNNKWIEQDNTLKDKYKLVKKVEVETITINDVLSMFLTEIDLMSIDIEGYDLKALQGMNFELYRPNIIVVEIEQDVKQLEYNKMIIDLLVYNGYLLYSTTQGNAIFVEKHKYNKYKKI